MKIEILKIKLDLLKSLILAFITALFGIFGYALINYKKLDFVLSLGIIVGLLILILFLIFAILQFFKYLKELERL